MPLQQNKLPAAISPEASSKLFSTLDQVSFPLKHVIYEVGAPFEYVYFIREGVASVITKMANGQGIEAGITGWEGMVGLPGVLGTEKSRRHVITQAPLTALRMDVADCRTALEESAAVRRILLRYAATLLDTACQTTACNMLHSLQQRCARWLMMMHDRLQSDAMPLTHEFFAMMLGTRRTRITETAVELQRLGLIRYQRGLVAVLDRAALADVACECYREHDRLMPD